MLTERQERLLLAVRYIFTSEFWVLREAEVGGAFTATWYNNEIALRNESNVIFDGAVPAVVLQVVLGGEIPAPDYTVQYSATGFSWDQLIAPTDNTTIAITNTDLAPFLGATVYLRVNSDSGPTSAIQLTFSSPSLDPPSMPA